MKRNRFLFCALFFAVGMLFFTFFTLALFSDQGLKWGWEIPIGSGKGPLSTAADIVWTASPFLSLLGILLSFRFSQKKMKFVTTSLLILGPMVYTVLQISCMLQGKDLHFSVLITLLFLFLSGIFALLAFFYPELEDIAMGIPLFHILLEIALFLLSVIFQNKFSQFYFGQRIYMGHHASFFYSYWVLSIFFYYIFYSASLALFLFSSRKKAISQNDPSENLPPPQSGSPETRESDSDENEEEDSPRLSLEDFGIER